MKFLFIIQGEGRGHLTQALALADILRRSGHKLSEVLVGKCKNRELPTFFSEKINAPITQYEAPTMEYGDKGRGTILKTITNNLSPSKFARWTKSIKQINQILDQSEADVIINFYEFLLGFALFLKPSSKRVVSIGHQFIVDHPDFKINKANEGGARMLRLNNLIASYGSTTRLALSFYPLPTLKETNIEVVPPLLRREVLTAKRENEEFYLGYMLNPAYLSEVLEWKQRNPKACVQLFWDKKDAPECEEKVPGLCLHRLNDEKFVDLMAKCRGYITTAGFESVCEAMYLGKPALMIPAHVEQQINAADGEKAGAGASSKRFDLSLLEQTIKDYKTDTEAFREWVNSAEKRFLDALIK